MTPYPDWLAWLSLAVAFLCALVILLHEFTKPQKMFIMNLVWPVTALYSSVAAFALTFAGGESPTRLLIEFLFAWFLGVIFQYFTIVPMRELSPGKGVLAAIRGDTVWSAQPATRAGVVRG